MKKPQHYTVVVIGSGFGGAMTGLTLAQAFEDRKLGETVRVLERGTWWTTPLTTVQDKEVRAYDFLRAKRQPVQFWPAVDHFKGLIDLIIRCVRRPSNADGLYDLTTFGRQRLLGLLGREDDGVTVLRASGVGGGSLVYSNVTIRPPDFIFDDPRWPLTWSPDERDRFFDLARHAIGYGVLSVWAVERLPYIPSASSGEGKMPWKDPGLPPKNINTGLSNVVTRSARLEPHWKVIADPGNSRGVKRIDLSKSPTSPDPFNDLWIDRARVFQTAMDDLTNDYGTVDSSINDVTPEPNPFDPAGKPANYCERQGRCNLGCLPGARHTLNKQLQSAIFGRPGRVGMPDKPPDLTSMSLEALAEVNFIRARPGGGYDVHYWQRDHGRPGRKHGVTITADKVILAAGCVGTTEILLRSRKKQGLPYLSERLGESFSTNGDYLAFLPNTREHVNLTRGPITTSFAHFHTPASARTGEPPPNLGKFHTVEDNGIPRALSSLTKVGMKLLQSLSKGHTSLSPTLLIVGRFATRLWEWIVAICSDARSRHELFESEDELTAKMMCIAAMGREQARGRFRLGGRWGESELRVGRTDKKKFHEDPIYVEIRKSLAAFAGKLSDDPDAEFRNPFLEKKLRGLVAPVALSHPLGGCSMGTTSAEGTVDEFGRVFDRTRTGPRPFYEGLYVADGAIIATALGVNPSLTISALALRIANNIVKDELGQAGNTLTHSHSLEPTSEVNAAVP